MNKFNPSIFLNVYSGRFNKLNREVQKYFCNSKKSIPIYTNQIKSTEKVIEDLSNKYNLIVAIGGDGTINNIVNYIDLKKNYVGFIPGGTGNDFTKMLNKNTVESFFNNLSLSNIIEVDVWEIKLNDGTKQKFINNLGFGLDAEVAYYSRTVTWLKGFPKYLYSAIQTVFSAKGRVVKVKTEKQELTEKIMFCCIGNGQFSGGGFRLTPFAKFDDGELDICIVKNAKVGTLLKVLPDGITGKHILHPLAIFLRGKNIEITCNEGIPLHADGELLGKEIKNAKIKLLKDKLKIVVP